MLKSLLAEFISPGGVYRGKPFWAWNGKLEVQELRRQVRLMHRMGLGGFFMHSRVGLETPYLSDKWFECIDACIDEAGKLGMEAWLYDEDRWPSGAAGGLVTKNEQYRMRRLRMTILNSPAQLEWAPDTLAAFSAEVKNTAAHNVRRIREGARPGKLGRRESILVFRVEAEEPSSWYNGFTYLDTMSHEAVKEFIRVTHEIYRKHCGKHFGAVVPGIFTDESNHGEKTSTELPWTPDLPRVFKKRYRYDLIGHLPELFYDVDGAQMSQARYHYHDCLTHLFVDAFARQLGQWCEKNGMLHTGHILCEETLSSQTNYVGGCMRFYEYMQAPGMDILTEYSREYDTAKQVSSAARQFGCKWRLTETYGCTGWDFPFTGHKAVGDWQAALGINLRCQHLSWYTMEGQAKRDYPAGIFYQSPWWELYPKVEDYFARLHAVLTRGVEVRDLLVVHPVESMWTLCKTGWRNDQAVEALDRMIVRLRDSLLAANIDFDYGDEDILARHGKVTRRAGAPTLQVGKAPYKAVIVPPLRTVRDTTLKLLEKFKDAGGLVVFAGAPAKFVDAQPSPAAEMLARRCVSVPAKGKRLADAVAPACRRISITDEKEQEIPATLYLLREDARACYLFVCNTGHDFRKTVHEDVPVSRRTSGYPEVRIRGFAQCTGAPVELDPDTGEAFAAAAKRAGGEWEIRTSLPPIGSRLFVIPKKKAAMRLPARPRLKDVRVQTLRAPKWDITLSQANVVVLDRPSRRIGKAAREKADEILRVDHAVRDALGVPRRGGAMVQPWARTKPARLKTIPVDLAYTFAVKAIPGGDLFLSIERPELYEVRLNGAMVNTDMECGWWCDRSLRKLRLDPSVLRLGANEISFHCEYDELHPGLEIVYLLGYFGVEVKGTSVAITRAPTTLRLGDWVRQGLPFYSGSVAYHRTIRPRLRRGERLFVQVPAYRGAAVRVLMNGQAAGVIAWEPNEVDVTEFIGRDRVDLAIEVLGHRRNSHGPLHLTDPNPRWTGPGEFVTSGDQWTDSYLLKPCGLMAAPKLLLRR